MRGTNTERGTQRGVIAAGAARATARRLLLLLALLVPLLPGLAAAQNAQVTLLHVNDVYQIAPVKGLGGLAELSTLLKRERAAHPGAITTVGGDFLSPSILSGLVKGAQMVELFNAIGVDYVTFGNHEFDFGPDVTRQRIAESCFVWLGTNVLGGDGKIFPGAVATATRQVGDVKFGFLGVLTPETASLSSGGAGIGITPPIEAAKAAVEKLRRDDGVHVVIALTHLDIDQDRALARAVPAIDVILGGHEHDAITYYEHGTLIHKSGSDAHFLGAVDLDVRTAESGGRKVTTVLPSWRMIANAGTPPDPEVAPIVAKYTDRLDRELGQPIGIIAVELDSRVDTVRSAEARIGNLIADALRTQLGADVALTNGGGIRGNRIYPAGTQLTRRDILTEMPFGNHAVLLEITGADLRTALESGVSEVEGKAGRFPQVAGLTVVYDPERSPNRRIRDVQVGGKPLDDAATYKLATTDFLAAGRDGYASLTRARMVGDTRFAPLLTQVVTDYVKAKGTVAPQLDGRILAKASSD